MARLLKLIEPHYPRQAMAASRWGWKRCWDSLSAAVVNLSDPQAGDSIYDSESIRRFARVELGGDVVPDETALSTLTLSSTM